MTANFIVAVINGHSCAYTGSDYHFPIAGTEH